MAKPRMDLSAFVGKLLEDQDGDVLREGIRVLSQALMETEVADLIGAERHERTPERSGHRNGYRLRTWDTRVGTTELAIRKIRPWTYFPSFVRRTYHKVRVDGRVISLTTVVALGDTTNGGRQVQGRDVGPSEDRDFWTAVLRSLVKRGLHGVRLVVSDANEGLKQAIANGADRHDLATPQARHGRRSRYLGRFSNQPVAEIVQCGEPISAFRGNSAHRAVF